FLDSIRIEVTAQAKGFKPLLQDEDHRLGHTGITRLGREPEVEIELYVPGRRHDTSLKDENVIPHLRYLPTYVARPRHIADDRSGLERHGIDEAVNGARHRQDRVG